MGPYAKRPRTTTREFLGHVRTENGRLVVDDMAIQTFSGRLVVKGVPDGEHKVWGTRNEIGALIRVTVELGP